jgi:hypothetical protein
MYLDPSAGKIGAALETVFGAATSGALKVDPTTGEATLKFLNDVQELTDKMGRLAKDAGIPTPLGGGFGEKIGNFNQQLSAGGENCAQDILSKFSHELESMKEAVSMSMRNYLEMDGDNARIVSRAGAGGR